MGVLDGKVAIVTGGASGIGEAAVRLFARSGARVLIGDIDRGGGGRVAADVVGDGGVAAFRATDVAQSAEVKALVTEAVDRWGRLDIIFNNAGVAAREGGIADSDEDEFDRTIAVDLKGVYLGIKHAVPAMAESGGGSIISTSSICGLVGFPSLGAYSASKAGVLALTRVAAVEYAGRGIRANAICPGIIATPMSFADVRMGQSPEDVTAAMSRMQPTRRTGAAEDIAQAALWLAGDASSFVTGQEIVVDGGYVIDGRRFGPPRR